MAYASKLKLAYSDISLQSAACGVGARVCRLVVKERAEGHVHMPEKSFAHLLKPSLIAH